MRNVSVSDWKTLKSMPEGNYYRVVGDVVALDIAGMDLLLYLPLSALSDIVKQAK